MIKIQLIIGSTRDGRASENVAKWLKGKLPQVKDVEFEFVDLRDFPLPFYDDARSAKMINGDFKHPEVKKWQEKINEADGFIFICAEYNHSFTAVLKNALDWLYTEWNNKAVAFVSYGSIAAGTRSVMQLTQVARELQMHSTREGVHIPLIWTVFDEIGNPRPDVHMPDPQPMFNQLIAWTKVLKSARAELNNVS